MNNHEKNLKRSNELLVPLAALSYCLVLPLMILYFLYTHPPDGAKPLGGNRLANVSMLSYLVNI